MQKCPYCDFNSYTLKEQLPEQRYIDALLRDLDAQAPCRGGTPARQHVSRRRHAQPVFAGGDRRVCSSMHATQLGFADGCEVTLEANPGTIERGRFAEYRAAGVTRVSLGAQSFDARQLKLLGRIHSADETRRAAEELHAAGPREFQSGSDVRAAGADVRQMRKPICSAALALQPAHLSQYHLTIEPGTVFAAAPPTQPDDEIVEEMLDRSLRVLGRRASSSTRFPATRAPVRAARTTSTTGTSATTWVSAQARTARSPIPRASSIVRTQQTREPRRYLAAEPGAADPQASVDPGFAVRVRDEWVPPGGGLRRTSCSRRAPGSDADVARTCAGRDQAPGPGRAALQGLACDARKASDFSTRYWLNCFPTPNPVRGG